MERIARSSAQARDTSTEEESEERGDGMRNWVCFDTEIQRTIQEVAAELGLANERDAFAYPQLMKMSVGVAYSSKDDTFHEFKDAKEMATYLWHFDGVLVGFNSIRFDVPLFLGHVDIDLYHALQKKPHIDILMDFYEKVGGRFRVSLDNVTSNTCGVKKNDSGAEAPLMFRRGEIERLMKYCKNDVAITAALFRHGIEKGFIRYWDSEKGSVQEMKVDWKAMLE